MYRDPETLQLCDLDDSTKDLYLALVLPQLATKGALTEQTTDLVLAQKTRSRHPGEGDNGTSSTSDHAA